MKTPRSPKLTTLARHFNPTVAGLALLALAGCGAESSGDPAAAAAPASEPATLARAATANQSGKRFAEGRLLVGPRAGLADADLDVELKKHGGKRLGKLRNLNVHVIQVPARAEEAIAKLLAKNPHLEFAELDMAVSPDATVNDPSFASQWHLPKIGAPTAWDTTWGDGVVVAVLDTGVDGSHPDLAANMVAGWNIYDNNADSSDVNNHGTWVAGVVAAAANNAVGVAGVAGKAKIMPLRISQPDGYAYWSTVASGITWAADRGAKVANVSYNGVAGSSTVQSAARYLKGKGGLTVVAAGNSGGFEAIAESPDLLTAAATTSTDARSSFSSYGEYVDIAAPGSSILTTARGGGYATVSGTSFASPCTAGVLALIMAANPTLGPDQVQQVLLETAQDLGTVGWDQYTGNGRVNAAAAVTAALSAQTSDTQAPTAAISAPLSGTVKDLVPVNVTASDNVGVAKVELYANGILVGTDTMEPWAFTWDSAKVADGTATLVAQATDAAGNRGTSKTVTVTVDNLPDPMDTVAPTVQILSPTAGSTVSGTVQIQVGASDNVGVTLVEVLIDGKATCAGNTSPLSCTWNTRKAAAGSHTITGRGRDAAGNVATVSLQVTIGATSGAKGGGKK